MAFFKQRNDPVRLFGRRLILLGLLALFVVAMWGVWSAYQKERESAGLRAQAEIQLDDLAKRQEQLNSDIARLQTDRGREEILREQYALAAKGEGLIVIVDPSTTTPLHATSTLMDKIKKAFWWW